MEAREKPRIVHYAGYQKPWDVADCDLAEYFWKYAAGSPYYPMLVGRIKRYLADEEPGSVHGRGVLSIARSKNESGLRKIVNRVLPYGSRRREAVKKVYKTVCRKQ